MHQHKGDKSGLSVGGCYNPPFVNELTRFNPKCNISVISKMQTLILTIIIVMSTIIASSWQHSGVAVSTVAL